MSPPPAETQNAQAAGQLESAVTLLGLPIPPITLLAEFVRLVARTAFTTPLHIEFCCDVFARDGTTPDREIYLRHSLAELTSLAGILGYDQKTRESLAIAGQFHKVCRSRRSISLDEALSDFWCVAKSLGKDPGMQLRPDAAEILRPHFAAFKAQADPWCDPLLWPYEVDLTPLLQTTTYRFEKDYSTGVGGPASWSLVDGWYGQEHWGAWSRGRACRLQLRTPPHTRRIILTCLKLRQQLQFTVLLNHAAVSNAIISRGIHDQIVVDVPQASACEHDHDIAVEIRIRNPSSPKTLGHGTDTRLLGIGLTSIRIEGAAPNQAPATFIAAPALGTFEETLRQAGFAMHRIAAGNIDVDANNHIANMLGRLAQLDVPAAPRMLLIGHEATALAPLIRQTLLPAAFIVCVDPSESVLTSVHAEASASQGDQSPAAAFLATNHMDPDSDDVLANMFDVVCVVGMEHSERAQALINLATCAVAPSGVILGQEHSAAAVRAVMGLVFKETGDSEITVVISGCEWRASAPAYGHT